MNSTVNDAVKNADTKLFHEMMLHTTVSVELRNCTSVDDSILKKLKSYEGKCLSNGFVQRDSIDIVSRTIGKTNIYNNTQ